VSQICILSSSREKINIIFKSGEKTILETGVGKIARIFGGSERFSKLQIQRICWSPAETKCLESGKNLKN